MSPDTAPAGLTGSGSFITRTNSTVPIGAFDQDSAGETPCCPAYFAGISPPSGQLEFISVSPGPAGAPPPPRCCAANIPRFAANVKINRLIKTLDRIAEPPV